MDTVSIYCPASISFLFQTRLSLDPLTSGSLGIGCTLNRGVILTVSSFKKTIIIFNGENINLPVIASVIKKISPRPVKIIIETPFPLGSGFGISGASALSCAYGINSLFHLEMERQELVKVAHTVEIEHHTGLGTVATQSVGGFLVKTAAGFPVHAYHLPFEGKKIYTIIIGRLATDTILTQSHKLRQINHAAQKALRKVNRTSTLEDILDISYQYAQEANLISDRDVRNFISGIRRMGGHATMAMLGHVVVADCKPEINYNYHTEELTITRDTVRIL